MKLFLTTDQKVLLFVLKNCKELCSEVYTASLSMNKPHYTIKDCMRLLKQNSYLTKLSDQGTVYHITKENMEFWHTDFGLDPSRVGPVPYIHFSDNLGGLLSW